MTMIAKITRPVTLVAIDRAGATAARIAARRAVPRSLNRNSPNLVIVVPDPLDAIAEVGREAGLKGGSKAALDARRPVAAGCLNRRRPI
jgi:hypothetical protein